jgi:hypothetical protein
MAHGWQENLIDINTLYAALCCFAKLFANIAIGPEDIFRGCMVKYKKGSGLRARPSRPDDVQRSLT